MVLPSGVKVHIAAGLTDTRKGMDGFAMMVERLLLEDPFSGHLFAFHGRRANLIKILCRGDGNGLHLFTKQLEFGGVAWPQADDRGGKVVPSTASRGYTGGMASTASS